MPTVKPFAGLLYAPSVPIARVATQPYDKISPDMQRQYLRRNAHNFARLILDEIKPSDDARDNRYTRAAKRLNDWIKRGVLRRDAAPAFFLYEQKFRRGDLGEKTRVGIIGLLRLEDFRRGNVLPHERTLAKPRKDRLRLLQATQANLEQIFLLYDDAQQKVERLLQALRKSRPALDFTDDTGVRQRLWRISGVNDVRSIADFLSKRRLFIADGHHRYTISLQYHQKIAVSRSASARLKENSAWRMATFVSMQSPGLVILPTHRLVALPRGWDQEAFLRVLGEDFVVEKRPLQKDLQYTAVRLARELATRKDKRGAAVFALLTKSCAAILTLRISSPHVRTQLARGFRAPFRHLDVAILHKLILEKRLGLDPKSVEQQKGIAYSREPEDVARKIESGQYALGFLQNSPDIEQVKRIALAGECMPQKSTDFYPKLLSGLVMYDMKERG